MHGQKNIKLGKIELENIQMQVRVMHCLEQTKL